MTEKALESTLSERLEPGGANTPLVAFARRHGWLISVLALIAAAALLLLWARTRPGYDPYGWLVWGHQALHLSLDLGGAPSWKPLPFLFTVPYALAGSHQLQLWMLTAAAVSLAGAVFGGRIAYRLVRDRIDERERSEPIRRYAPLAAGIFAGVAVLGLQEYMHSILSAQSDPVIVTCCLAAIDCHLRGRYRLAFAVGVLASLGRPEAWPALALYSLWVWFNLRSMRWMVLAGVAVIAFMWFGIPWITNGRPDEASHLAFNSPRELRHNQATGTISRLLGLQYPPIWIASAAVVALAWRRRDRALLALAGFVGLWAITEVAFALHGYAALPRYMFEAGAVVAVLAGVGVGLALSELPTLRPGLPSWSGIPIVAVLLVTLAPGAVARLHAERTNLTHERRRSDEIGLLQTTVNAIGGYSRVRACGEPVTYVEYASALAWLMRLDVGSVGYKPELEMRRRHPIVLFFPVKPGGWAVRPWHTDRHQHAECVSVHARYELTGQHPAGVLIRP
jgi:hypothetical protein